jgi:hypothetical protein
MASALFTSIAATGFAVAFLHAALPTHWLPFVLIGRARAWPLRKTLGVTAIAGVGHVVVTVLLGGALTALGLVIRPQLGAVFPFVVGGLLIAFGVLQMVRHRHAKTGAAPDRRLSDGAATLGLIAFLALSPSEAFLPLFLANTEHGWAGFAVLSMVLAGATLAGMLLFTGLTAAGAARLNLGTLERYEGLILGVVLCLLGVGVMVLEG